MPLLHITIDTCVWLKLLQIDFNNEDNYLEELCYWIENGHLGLVMPVNMINEWNRNKLGYQDEIVSYFRKKEENSIRPFRHNAELASTYNPGNIEKKAQDRIVRIDFIFSNYAEQAPFDNSILILAGVRNLATIAPNHVKDSYRDTVNILSLIHYLKNKKYSKVIFTTINYKDFSNRSGKRYELHDQLEADFKSSNLSYEYFDEGSDFGTRLFNSLRRELSAYNYQKYLTEKRAKEEVAVLEEKKVTGSTAITNPDPDYLENIKYMDLILAKKTRTLFEEEIIRALIARHESYRQYFFSKVD